MDPKEQREPKKTTSSPPTVPKSSPVKEKLEKKEPSNADKVDQQKTTETKQPSPASSPIKKDNGEKTSNHPDAFVKTPDSGKSKSQVTVSPASEKSGKEKSPEKKPTGGDNKSKQPDVSSDSKSPTKTSPNGKVASSSSVDKEIADKESSKSKDGVEVPKLNKKPENGTGETPSSVNKDKTENTIPEILVSEASTPEKIKQLSSSVKEDKSITPQKVADVTNNEEKSGNANIDSTQQTNKSKENDLETVNDKNNNETPDDNKQGSLETSKNREPPTNRTKHESKFQLRSEMWSKMFRSSMLAFRKPCNYRIPHFKGDIISAGRLSTMDIFQKAKVVKVSLDKAHECVRLQVIEAGKEMIVGCPGLREAVFLHVRPPMEPSKSSNKLASSRIGIGHVGSALDFSSGTQADLVIVGSVAVDRTGLRVGKGEGFADLEYALLKKLGGIAPNAPIVTVVHDSQVLDKLPEGLFKDHDVPADYIVTPTQVIEVSPKRNHPDLNWSILSNRRVNSIPIIKQLLDREQSTQSGRYFVFSRDGVTVSLKEDDTDSEELEQIARRKRYFLRRRIYAAGNQRIRRPSDNRISGDQPRGRTRRHTAPSERNFMDIMTSPQNRTTRTFRNRSASLSRFRSSKQNFKQDGFWAPRNFENGIRKRYGRKPTFRPKYSVDFSLKVHGLTNGIRVRDLKAAINQRGIRPRDISWLPHKGVAFLHFAKCKIDQTDGPALDSQNTDTVIASLKDLKVKAENGPVADLRVEAAQPFRKVHFTV